jgi:hypothetical protein
MIGPRPLVEDLVGGSASAASQSLERAVPNAAE